MTGDYAKRLEFQDKIQPDLEVLMQFSIWLTKNGRDATLLVREAMSEAYRTWDDWKPEESRKTWLHKILTRQFFKGIKRPSRNPISNSADSGDTNDGLFKNNRLVPFMDPDDNQASTKTDNQDPNVSYCQAIASLPDVLRPAMILSYLEGFSNREIAELAGVQPNTVEALLNKGRKRLRDELFVHLMGDENPDHPWSEDEEQE